MAVVKPPIQKLGTKSVSIVAIVAIAIAIALSGCSSGETDASAPWTGSGSPQSQSESDATTKKSKTMTEADRAARDSLIIDLQARGFSYVSDQTIYNPELDTTDTGGLSTNVFSFVVEVGDCANYGELSYTKVNNATRFILDDWSAKLTLNGKTVGDLSARMSVLSKRAYLWKNSHPELYECLTGKPSN